MFENRSWPTMIPENNMSASLKLACTKDKPDGDGDCFSQTQKQTENFKNGNGTTSTFVPPAIKSFTAPTHNDSKDNLETKRAEFTVKPVFGPVKTVLTMGQDLNCLHELIDQRALSESTKVACGREVSVEEKSGENTINSDDLDNEAENALLCQDWTSGDKPDPAKQSLISRLDNTSPTRGLEPSNLTGSREHSFSITAGHNFKEELVKNRSVTRQSRNRMLGSLSVNFAVSSPVTGGFKSKDTRDCGQTVTVGSMAEAEACVDSQFQYNEAAMAQEKLIRNKKHRKVHPCCGRWLEVRKRGGTMSLSSVEPDFKGRLAYQEVSNINSFNFN